MTESVETLSSPTKESVFITFLSSISCTAIIEHPFGYLTVNEQLLFGYLYLLPKYFHIVFTLCCGIYT